MQELSDIVDNLAKKHAETHSWRKAGELYGIDPASARALANGYIPGKKLRMKLGLAPVYSVVVMTGDPLPAGTQVIMATLCKDCGRWYISNHPARKRCFICRPYGGKR